MKTKAKEILIYAAIIAAFSLTSAVFFINADFGSAVSVTYSANKSLSISLSFALRCALAAVITGSVYVGLIFTLDIGRQKCTVTKKHAVSFGALAVMGVAAYSAMAAVLAAMKFGAFVSVLIAAAVSFFYFTVIYKLYFENKANSNALVWEIIRFGIVGVIAAAFDFFAAYFVQFFAFKGLSGWYITPIATACGFAVGVTINYILSTYAVYKNSKSDLSKSVKGVIIFVALSAVGLFIGIGLQYLLYDILYIGKSVGIFTYPVDFVIRTLVVMVYNYTSRKAIIYK